MVSSATAALLLGCILISSSAFSVPSTKSRITSLKVVDEKSQDMFFLAEREQGPAQRRVLGSQELLMLPRQYSPESKPIDEQVVFPQMNHVSCTILSATPSERILRQAIDETIKSHPLLRAYVEGDGEPDERIDGFQMVRKGDPNPCTFVAPDQSFTSNDVLGIIDVEGGRNRAALDKSWQSTFGTDLDDGGWCSPENGPMWKVELHRIESNSDSPCALVFSFNHAISDQSSANMMTDQIVSAIADFEVGGAIKMQAVKNEIPVALEDSVLGAKKRFGDVQLWGFGPGTIGYIAGKAAEGFKSPVIIPDNVANGDDGGGILGALTIISGNAAGGKDKGSQERKSTLQFRKLSEEATTALLEKCRKNGVTVTNALTAVMTLVASDFIDNGTPVGAERNYKVLQSLDMRRFGKQLDKGESVACMAGSMDLMHGPIEDRSGASLRKNPTPERLNNFWQLAVEGRNQTSSFINGKGPQNAVKVFDMAMTISDMNNLVDLTSKSKASQGRAYSAGVSNVGVYERQTAVRRAAQVKRETLKTKHGKYEVEDVFFATSHARTGCLYQISAMTVGGEMKCTFHPASPIVSEETNAKFADAFIETLEIVAGTKKVEVSDFEVPSIPKNLLPTITAIVGGVAIASHAEGFGNFYNSVMEMRANIDNPEDFWGALNFWIFFAVGHPILQPILWISDVLHGSPGTKIADLVPYTFVAGNVVAIATIAVSKEIRNSVNIAALCAFLAYVGAGLDGQAGLSDYNLSLDDPYGGKVVKGCPAYEKVRQPSMDSFDLQKYQGLWYEQKFHDWTQFKEVYDTTLDIKLTPDGQGWVDDFGVKGPAEKAAPLSWDKSPVANGAHYFLFGQVDKRDPPGVLRESGFGVEFPDYIVDVQKDPVTGEYTEAIQFQCLERGGVRVFEGINFMSRKPQMSDTELTAMHARAKKAGMYKYGASPEQMHTVARRPVGAPAIDNSWQAMWRAIGVDKLLELLTESIEDGGR